MSFIEEIFENRKLNRLNNIKRWNGISTIKEETVAQHTFMVSLISRAIIEDCCPPHLVWYKLDVATYSLLHDFDEVFTGDIGHEIKYNDTNGTSIKELLKDFVKSECTKMFSKEKGSEKSRAMFKKFLASENITLGVKEIVKVADWLSMCLFLKTEIELGNSKLVSCLDYCIGKLKISCHKALEKIMEVEEIYCCDFDVTVFNDILDLTIKTRRTLCQKVQ